MIERVINFFIRKKNSIIVLFLTSITIGVALYKWSDHPQQQKRFKDAIAVTQFQKEFTKQIDFDNGKWPRELNYKDHHFKLTYTFNSDLERYVKKVLKRFFTKNASVVVLDNNSGAILTALDYSFKGRHFGSGITFSSTHPAASLFKIVSLSAMLNSGKTSLQQKFRCRGRGTTLYRYQLDDRKRSWDRKITLKNAFAYSNNVVIARAAQRTISPTNLTQMAQKFMFNRNIYGQLLLSSSLFISPADEYNLAEKASGFNRETLISPVHGAALSMIIARGGTFVPISVLDKIEEDGHNLTSYYSEHQIQQVLSSNVAKNVAQAMEQVVRRGTARRHMRSVVHRFKRYLSIGGKTGRISGGFPEGTRDWFSVYAKPKNGNNKGISICVMNINGSSWYVKSSYIAKKIIEYYYSHIVPIKKISKQELVHNNLLTKGES